MQMHIMHMQKKLGFVHMIDQVIPIAVTSARCWPRRSFRFIPGTIDVSIGKPISATGREPQEMMEEIEAWIETEMRRLDPEAYD